MTHDAEQEERSVLVVDDDELFRTRVVQALRERGFEAAGVSNHEEALSASRDDSPELALVDLRLRGKSGLEVVRDLRALDPTTMIVVLTGYGSIVTAVESMKLGANSYLTKPADADQIVAAFERESGGTAAEPRSVPSLARVEWEHIQRVLADCDWNISQAARLLGIHRRSLQRKLAKRPASR